MRILFLDAARPEDNVLRAAYNLTRCEEVNFTMEGKKRFLRYVMETTEKDLTVSTSDMDEINRREFLENFKKTVRTLQKSNPVFARNLIEQAEKDAHKLSEIAGGLWISFNERYDRAHVWRMLSILLLFHERENAVEWTRNLTLLMDDHVMSDQKDA